MAKSKGKESKAKPASKKKDNTLLYGLGVLILIVIIVLVVKSGNDEVAPADVNVGPSGPESPIETQPQELPAGITEELKCTEGAVIGFKACNPLSNGDVELIVLHGTPSEATGVTPLTLTGAQYYLYDENGEKLAEASQMGNVEPGQEATYTLPVSQNPGTIKVEVRPVVNDGGVDKICINQHVLVPVSSCR